MFCGQQKLRPENSGPQISVDKTIGALPGLDNSGMFGSRDLGKLHSFMPSSISRDRNSY